MLVATIYQYLFFLLATVWAIQEQDEFDLIRDQHFEDDDASYERLSHDSLLWGPYNSGRYLGIRPRIPESLLSGLMWFNVDSQLGVGQARDFYEQGDNMARANWVQFDPRLGGRQVIHDNDCHINITIDFVKSENGRNWAVKIKLVPHAGHESVKTSFVWYSGLQGERKSDGTNVANEGVLKLDIPRNENGYKGTVKLSGFSEELGLFEIKINDGGDHTKNKHPSAPKGTMKALNPKRTHHLSLRVPNPSVWQNRGIFMTLLKDSVQDILSTYAEETDKFPPHVVYNIRNMNNYEGNLHFVQKMFEGEAEFDVIYTDVASPPTERFTFETIQSRIDEVLSRVNRKFRKNFQLHKFLDRQQEFGQEMLSGLLGGLSYFYGDQLVDRQSAIDADEFLVNDDDFDDGETEIPKLKGDLEGPYELFTLVPSRPFFPRGFYWDEGFHLLPLLKYDSDLALEIIKSWFNLIDDDGWIAREQILGAESRSRVPAEFQVQSPAIVNPPTLMLAFTYLLDSSQRYKFDEAVDLGEGDLKSDIGQVVLNNPEMLANYTRQIYPKLKLHFDMFRRTQQGSVEEFNRGQNKEAYRWRGRTVSHSLASGIDDYPRPLPLDVAELNVDLLCWMGVMTRSIRMIAGILELKEDEQHFAKVESNIIDNLAALHWSEEHKAYCDASVDDDDEHILVCHKGYVSLFPFLTKMVPAESVDKIESIVDNLTDPEELWSDYGIRSLSKADEFYRTGENYWRSPVWININYLILENLQHYHEITKPYASRQLKEKIEKAYSELRQNLIKNVYQQWEKTGFVWESYDDQTGANKGAKNFLGWTSTVLLMMEMPEKLD